MITRINLFFLSFLILPFSVWSAETAVVSSTGGVLKMVLGLVVVLAIMALITWVLKRFMPNIGSNKQSVVRVVGGVSVGSRERVVVLEVAGRWLVVGVASGQVNSLANLDAGTSQLAESITNASLDGFTQSFAPSFAQWLKKSAAKFTETNSTEKSNEK